MREIHDWIPVDPNGVEHVISKQLEDIPAGIRERADQSMSRHTGHQYLTIEDPAQTCKLQLSPEHRVQPLTPPAH